MNQRIAYFLSDLGAHDLFDLQVVGRAPVVFGNICPSEQHTVVHDVPNAQRDEQDQKEKSVTFCGFVEYKLDSDPDEDRGDASDKAAGEGGASAGSVILGIEVLHKWVGLYESGVLQPRRDEECQSCEDAGEREKNERAVAPIMRG